MNNRIITLIFLVLTFEAISENTTIHGTGLSKYNTCNDLAMKARNICSSKNAATLKTSQNLESCMSSCNQNGVNIECSFNFSCDSNRSPEIMSVRISETATHTIALDESMVCRGAKRKAGKQVESKCKEFANTDYVDDLITEKNYGSCKCKPMTFKLSPTTPAFQCTVNYTATCNKGE
ncbi:MAG: hypothetical protein R3E90_06200 [Marinicella sp.]